MADFEVGQAWVSLQPSAKGFSKKAKQELAAVGDLDKSVDLDADKSKLEAAIKQVKAQLKALDREKASPSLDFESEVAEAKIREVTARLQELSAKKASPKVDVETAKARQELDTLERQLAAINERRANASVDVDIAAGKAALAQLEQKLDEVDRRRAEPTVTADVSQARQRLTELEQALSALDMKRASPKVEVAAAQAQQEVLRIRAELDRLGAMRASPQVNADIASASAKLAAVTQQVRALDGKTAHVNVNADSGGRASLILMGVVAALGAIGAAAPAAAGALAAVGGAVGGLGQGVAAAMAGFSGIGDALKALEQDEKSAATSSAASSNSRASGAKQVASAQRALESAQVSADRAAITGAQQVSQAQQALAQARRSQARTAASGAQQVADAERSLAQAAQASARTQITSGQQVAAARRAVADAMVSASARVASAERSLENANRSRQYAQEALTRATQEAARANRDLQLSVAGGALATERATLSLQQARQRLAQSTSRDPLELADLSLSVREAEQQLKETQVRYGDLTQEQAKWARTGVQGSDQVVAAQRSLQDAQRGVGDAQRGLTEAQVSGARQVADAQDSLAKAQQQAAWAQQDAAQQVADAQRNVGRAAADAAQANADAAEQTAQAQQGVAQAVQQAGWQQQDAARAVADAQRQLAEAYEAGGDSAAGAAKKAAYALAQLTPAGRSMVDFLKNEWQPTWKKTSDAVADAMLPKVERAMRNLLALEPVFRTGLAETGSILGDLAVRGSELATSPPFMANFATIMASNNRQLQNYGSAGFHLFGAFTDLYTVAGPVSERFSRMADNSMQAFESFIIGKRATGELESYLQRATDVLMYVGKWLVDVAVDVYQFATSLAPLGVALLETVRYLTDWIAYLSQLNPYLTSFTVGVGLAAVGASKLGTAMKGLAIANAAGGLRSFGSVLSTVVNPAALNGTTAMQKLRGAFDTAGLRAGVAAEKMTGSAKAGERVATASSAAGRAASGFASGLPVVAAAVTAVAIAHDAMNTSFAEGVPIMGKGGAAARTLREEFAANDKALQEMNGLDRWANETFNVIESTESFNRKLKDLRATWTDLENAQYDAGIAQGDYELALRESGPTSDRTREAQRQLAEQTGRVAREQEEARRATMNATQALEDQQNKILGSINARLGYEQSVRSTKEAQQALNDEIARSGPNSLEAEEALGRLQQQQTAQADAASRAAAEEAKKRGETDTSAASTAAYATEVGKLVAQSTGELTPALQQMVQGLDASGLAAAGAKVHINDAGVAVATFPDGKTVTMDAQTAPTFYANLQAAKAAVDSTKGTIGVDADPGLGEQKVGNFKLRTDATTGVVSIDGNITPADQQRLGIQAKTDGTTGTMFIDGNPVPCDGALNGMRVTVDKTTGVMTIDGDKRPADQRVNDAQAHASERQVMPVDANTDPADASAKGWWARIGDWFRQNPLNWDTLVNWVTGNHAGGPVPGRARGGYVGAYASGGAISHKKVIGFPAGGNVRGAGTSTSDSIPALLSNGEYVIRASAVQTLGVPTLDALNRMATGGPVGYAAGGRAKPVPSAAAPAAPAVPVPTGDPSSAAAAAGATDLLSGSMQNAAAAASGLTPQLAAVTAQQQSMAATGVAPLAGLMNTALFPALAQYGVQVGTQIPLANQAMQTAQAQTQLSTMATAANTAANTAWMANATTGMSLQAQAQHAGLRAGQFATQLSTNQTAANTAANNAVMAGATTNMSAVSQGQHSALRQSQGQTVLANNVLAADTRAQTANMAGATTSMSGTSQLQHSLLRQSQGQTVQANNALASNTQAQTQNMSGATTNMSGVVQNHLGQVRGSQGVTSQSTTAFADSWRDQLGRTMPDSGNPLRWVINFPIRSITDAWNHLDRQFALGKHVPPYVPNFATGGSVSGPGGGTDDKVPAMLSNGEFVVREAITSRVGPFLRALNAGQPEALQAASANRRPDPMVRMADGGSVAGAIARAVNVARSMSGKPYIWGGASPAGADCSGYQSIITNALRGDGQIYRRIGTTGTFPWGGFTPGLTSAYSIGAFKGNPGHMAGTLAGVNVESGGSPSKVKYGAGAVGADNGQFNIKSSLPVVGGKFVSGGAGGGGFDPTPAVDEAFAKAYREIGDIPKFFGPSDQVARDQGVARFSADKVKAHALTKLMEMFASSGGGGNAAMWRPQIAQALGLVGQPLAHVGITERRMNQESGGNPRAINNWDSNARKGTPSKGLMQVIDPTFRANWDPRTRNDIWDPLANITASMHYALRRYGSLPAAYNRPGGYDNGGLIQPGRTLVENNTGMPERVLNNVETKSYDTLTQLVGKNGVKLTVADPAPSSPTIGTLHATVPQGATVNDMARAVTFQVRRAKRGGVYA